MISPAARPSRSCDVMARSPTRSPTEVPGGPWRPGRSLELLNPASDNANPANWALSVASGGTPGLPNQSGGGGDTAAPNTTVTAPAANAVLGSSAVTMTGTASDNVDVDRVNVTLQNTTTGAWLQPNGTFGTSAAVVTATLVNDTVTTTGWQVSATLPNGVIRAHGHRGRYLGDRRPLTRDAIVHRVREHRPRHRGSERHPHRAIRRSDLHHEGDHHVRYGHGRPRHGQGGSGHLELRYPASGCTPTARSERGSSSLPPSRWITGPR